MALYRYKALNARGEMLDGQMEAASDGEVALRLQEQGHLPVEARLASESSGESAWRALFKPKPFAGARLVQFTQQLATLLGAGQPLDRALSILLELPEDDVARRTIHEIREAVRGGASLSAALERQHGDFGRLYVNMVRAGEAGGNLHDTLQQLADYLERSSAMRAQGDQCAGLPGDPVADGRVVAAVPAGLRGAAVLVDVRKPGCRPAVVLATGAGPGRIRAQLVDHHPGGSGAGPAVAGPQASRPRVHAEVRRLAAAAQAGRHAGGADRDRAAGAHPGHPAAQRRAVAGRAGHRPQRAGQPRAGGRRGCRRRGRQERRGPVARRWARASASRAWPCR